MDKIGATLTRVFTKGRMNKSFDERVLPDGEYIDAMNIRAGSTEESSIGAIENSLGNTMISQLVYDGLKLSDDAVCLGAFADPSRETIFWFVTDPGNVDLIVSFNENTNNTTYHVVSTSVLSFDKDYRINGINLVENLLFWTDNLNPPRRIDIKRAYPQPLAGVDQITEEDINVIVKPPLEPPTISMFNIPGEENYIDDRMVTFSYRYKYRNGEYSALSPFSEIAFEPSRFELDYATYNNAGMSNVFNAVEVGFNTGGDNVVGIDLCFKLSDDNVINVIEKYDKAQNGWADNDDKSVVFSNRKIYTTLPQSELLRLYDNVPRRAKAQTVIGNRIVYGNYVDGYNIESEDGIPINVDLFAELISEDVEPSEQNTTLSNGVSYNIDATSSEIVSEAKADIELDVAKLKEGSSLIIEFTIAHDRFGGDPSYSDAPENQFDFLFVFTFQRDYVSIQDLAESPEFISAVSTSLPILDCSNGVSLTDFFNCSLVTKAGWTKVGTGISGIDQGFQITHTPTTLSIQCVAAKYKFEDAPNPTLYAYEYFTNAIINAFIEEPGNNKSLHSNRDYEVGISYLDDYGRASTVLVSQENTVFCPPSASDKKNSIQVSINNTAPYWAKKYRLFMKQSKSGYDTIFSDIYYTDEDGFTWFKVSGENASKINTSSQLIVKKDSIGPLDNLVKTKPLEVVFRENDFIDDNGIFEPAGQYMKIFASNFTAITKENANYDIKEERTGNLTQVALELFEDNPDFVQADPISPTNRPFRPIPIPAGSLVYIKFSLRRDGRGTKCESYYYTYEKRFTAARDYESFDEMVIFQNIDFTTGTYSGGEDQNVQTQDNTPEVYNPTGLPFGNKIYVPAVQGTDQWAFQEGYEDPTDPMSEKDGRLYLIVASGTPSCSGNLFSSRRTLTNESIVRINQPSDIVIFETEADESPADIYYESYKTFDIVDGLHQGDIQNQTVSDPAVVDSGFFNCFSFGNGCESYRYTDSIVGRHFNLGERVSSTPDEVYSEGHRYGSITYSGIYNIINNVNKLNEFNLGLVNYEDLEYSFGPIQYLYGRKNDMLTLQEDKISYVLVGKDLLSDAGAGQALTSVPQVFGEQIPRLENYGMSMNPESFASYGYDMYFTDAKRTAVINIKGSSYSNDTLNVISDIGLKYWFRNEFKESVDKVRIGGYDPYMSEYVLSLKDERLPFEPSEYDCGFLISQFKTSEPLEFKVNLGNGVGESSLSFNFEEGSADVTVEYDGVNVIDDQRIASNDTVSFEKSNPLVSDAFVRIVPDEATYTVSSLCPENDELTVVKIVVNSAGYVDQTSHVQYKWKFNSYVSPTDTDYVTLESDGVSLERQITGEQSQGVIPVNGSDVLMISNQYEGDTFEFDPTINKFKYLASNTLYDVATLLPLTTLATPILNPSTGKYYAVAEDVNLSSSAYLYLVWDYRKSSEIGLCYSVDSQEFVCCNCEELSTYYIDAESFDLATAIYTDSGLTILAPDGHYSTGIAGMYREVIDGELQAMIFCPDCDPCTVWTGGTFIGEGGIEVEFSYLDCDFVQQAFNITLPVNPTPSEPAAYTLSPFRCAINESASMTPIEGVSDVTFEYDSEEECGGTATCWTWEVTGVAGPGGADYIDCSGNNQSVSVLEGETVEFCASNTPSETGFGSVGLVSTSCTIP